MKNISWENIDNLEDIEITYLLYIEGKDIKTISRIRNIDKNEIERHIIQAKIKYRAYEGNSDTADIVRKLMRYSREERINILKNMPQHERKKLEEYAVSRLFESSKDECLFYIWLLGELRSRDGVNSLMAFLKSRDGNIKRMCCSALGKIGDLRAEDELIKALRDSRPQVREYTVKALGRIGSLKALEHLKGIVEDSEEKEYVKRAAETAIQEIEAKVSLRLNV
ncbi:HEAT repeat domain-containing protein [Fonticella tunisiensis]|uniref:Helix-turn-helix protein n=1 Tax=Fonticella tunisiensis TaxID=1096341 RepID=A0A4V3ERW2_9CLOT|nr:HEAT repeat domain-containing protein [Fonticella tunisiensis]TDT47633.1 helix-turn-helix protein [Fonticella tunisiensis]